MRILPALMLGVACADDGTAPGSVASAPGEDSGEEPIPEETGVWGPDAQGVTVNCKGVALRAEATAEGVVRLRYGPRRRGSFAVLGGAPPADPKVEATPAGWAITEAGLRVEIDEADCAVRAFDPTGVLLLDDPPGGGIDGANSLRRRLAPGERILGLGGRTGGMDRRGRRLDCWTTDAYNPSHGGYAPDADPLYACIPFYLAERQGLALGVFTDATVRSQFDIGLGEAEVTRVTVAEGGLDQHLIAGPDYASVLRRYTALTGRAPLPPRFGLGFHQSRWGWESADTVRGVVDQYAALDLPLAAVWLDIQHMDGFRVFTWDPVRYADPAGLVADLAGQGVASVAILDPGIKVEPGYPVYDQFVSGDLLLTQDGAPYEGVVWPGYSVFPDFSAPAARAAWGDWVEAELALGLDGLWLDMNEPAVFDGSDAAPETIWGQGEGDPIALSELRNVYALLQAQATYEAAQAARPERRPYLLSRSGYAGIQRYAAAWTGDAPSNWSTLRGTPAMLMGMSLSGQAWVGSDVGGYSGGASPELFARWMQVGLWSPFFRAHLVSGAADQYPWSFGTEVLDISRELLRHRLRLLPHLYTLGAEAAENGAPPLRPVAWVWPGSEAAAQDDVLLWGDHLLVAPILDEGASSRSLILPPGRWFEWQTGIAFEGGGPLVREALPLAAMPVFVREGAILARGPALPGEPPLTLELWPHDESRTGRVYEDAGDGAGAARWTTVTVTPRAEGLAVEIARAGDFEPGHPFLRLRLPRVDEAPAAALLGGVALAAVDAGALASGETGYRWDPIDLSLAINLPDRGAQSLEITVNTALSALAPPVDMPFRVSVPPGTPTDRPICIASALDGWASHQPLAWVSPTEAAGTLRVPRGEYLYYKFTRGDWETVEKWPDCVEATNRYELGRAAEKVDTVYAWRDSCP